MFGVNNFMNTQKITIPQNWQQIKIEKIFKVKSGQGFKANEYVPDGVRLLQIENVGYGDVKWKKKNYLSEEYLKRYPELHLKEGDIVLALNRPVTNNRLKIARLKKSDEPSILYQRVGKIIANDDIVEKTYIYQISNIFLKKFVISQSIGSDQPYIAMKDLYNYKLILPPLPEQKRIVSILETWDNTIEKLSNKIKLKKQLKKGLMQKLLTGDVRLPGFSGVWIIVALGDIGNIRTSSVDKKSVEGEKEVKLLNYMDVYRRDNISQTDIFQKVTANDNQIISSNLKKRDVLFTPSSETKIDIGHSAVVMEDLDKILFSYHLIRFRPNKDIINYKFSAYCFKGYKFYLELWKKSQGATRFTLSKEALEKSKIKIPKSQEEQKAIANILISVDKEINLLQQKLDEFKKQKKYLLNKLVTGEIRTPESINVK